jgi:type I restriction enzyme, S subunit
MSETMLKSSSVRSWAIYPSYTEISCRWLSRLPTNWQLMSLKRLLVANDGGVWGEDFDTDGVPVLRSTDMTIDGRWQVTDPAVRRLSPSEMASSRLLRDDIVITKSSGSQLHLGKSAIVTLEVEATGACFSNFMQRIRANASLYPKFLWWLLNSEFAREQLFFNGCTTTGLVNLSGKIIGNTFVTQPTFDEQRAIAAFLDRETARIDALVAKKQRLIELLEEKRQAVICHAVTKGLDPHVVCTESGVEWIGKIPQHWTLPRVSSFCNVVRGASPRPAGDPQYFNGFDTPWITVAETTKDKAKYLTETSEYLTSEGKNLSRFLDVDTFILTNSGATLGVPKILRIAGCINDGSVAFLDIDKRMSKDFLYYYFTSQTDDIRIRMNRGMGQPNLNTDIVSKMPVPCPPSDEQFKIAAYLDEVTEISCCQCTAISRSINLLMEYRTALISAAVTGQIDVRQEVLLDR